mgnify:CR=1 FL=1
MMGKWKDYTIYSYGEKVDRVNARSKNEAVELYVEKCIEMYKEYFGSQPTNDMIEDAYKNTEAADLSN